MDTQALRQFFDEFDNLRWGELHYAWLDEIAPHLRDELYTQVLQRAQAVLQAAHLPAEVAEAILPQQERHTVGTWAYACALLRRLGVDPGVCELEEILVHLGYALATNMAKPQGAHM